MPDKSDVVALEQILNYAAQEAQRLHLSPVVVHCLRMAVFELAKTALPCAESAAEEKDTSLH